MCLRVVGLGKLVVVRGGSVVSVTAGVQLRAPIVGAGGAVGSVCRLQCVEICNKTLNEFYTTINFSC